MPAAKKKQTEKATQARLTWTKKDADGNIMLTTKALGNCLGVAEPSIREWVKKGCPRHSLGWFVVKDVINWKHGHGKQAQLSNRKEEADARYRESRAQLMEMEQGIKENKYIDVEILDDMLVKKFSTIRQQLLTLAHNVSILIHALYPDASKEAKKLVDREVRNTLEVLASGSDDSESASD